MMPQSIRVGGHQAGERVVEAPGRFKAEAVTVVELADERGRPPINADLGRWSIVC